MDTTAYNVLLLLHIASIVVAFGPAALHGLLSRQYAQEGPEAARRFSGYMVGNTRRVYAPALVLAGLFGILLVLQSDEVWQFDQTWVNLAILVWFGMNGVLHGLVVPGERKLAAGDPSGERRVDLGGMLVTLLFLVQLYIMIWKPGL